MRNNQPVTQREQPVPLQANILSITDPRGWINHINDEFTAISGYRQEELLGQPHNLIRHPDMPRVAFEAMWQRRAGQTFYQATAYYRDTQKAFTEVAADIEAIALGAALRFMLDLGRERIAAHEAMLRRYFPAARPVTYSRLDWLYGDLREGKLDGVFGDGMRLSFWLAGSGAGGCCRFVGGPYLAPEFLGHGLAIAVGRDDAVLAQAFDHALREIGVKGVFAELYLKYFPVGFY